MDKYEATFEIESKTNAHTVERLMNRLYDMLREESRTRRKRSANSTEILEQFKAIRDATRRPMPGKLTIVYESKSKEFFYSNPALLLNKGLDAVTPVEIAVANTLIQMGNNLRFDAGYVLRI